MEMCQICYEVPGTHLIERWLENGTKKEPSYVGTEDREIVCEQCIPEYLQYVFEGKVRTCKKDGFNYRVRRLIRE